MNSFFVALNAIMPTFLLLAFGYFLRQMHFVKDEFLKQTNTLVFKFFLPVLLFNNIYTTNLLELFDGTMFLFAIGSLLLLYAALCATLAGSRKLSAGQSASLVLYHRI